MRRGEFEKRFAMNFTLRAMDFGCILIKLHQCIYIFADWV
jgi:hypothetical protein